MHKRLSLALGVFCSLGVAAAAAGGDGLSFGDVWRRVQERGAAFKAARLSAEAAEARSLQAAVKPAPSFLFEVENFAGSGESRGVAESEAKFEVSRTIEMGGKATVRRRIAEAEKGIAEVEARAKRLDAWRDTVSAFAGVLAAQTKADLAEDDYRLLDETLRAVRERSAAGKVSGLDAARAEADLHVAGLAREKARKEAENAGAVLMGIMGESGGAASVLKGDLSAVASRPLDARLSLDGNTALRRMDHEILVAEFRVLGERAAGVPDVEVSAGVRYAAGPGDYSLVAGIAVPLPAGGRNRHGITAAQRDLERMREERRAEEQALRTELTKLVGAANTAATEIAALSSKVLPSVTAVVSAVREAYTQGKLGYLDLLQAERSLVETRGRFVDAQAEFCQAMADVARLVGDSGLIEFFTAGAVEARK